MKELFISRSVKTYFEDCKAVLCYPSVKSKGGGFSQAQKTGLHLPSASLVAPERNWDILKDGTC